RAGAVTTGIDNYTVAHYTEGGYDEAVSYREGRVRDDQVNTIRYILGFDRYLPYGNMMYDHAVEFLRACGKLREPELVLTVGSGRGELEAVLAALHVNYVACDPSPGAAELTPRTVREWAGVAANFRQMPLKQIPRQRWWPDTVVFN